ncbi:MAG: type II toxin-antitoxin system ParD family antitoxin [Devosia sp.]|jgi:antitoxin ParD1/3/4|uniref:type II toxin-antitoxin system ParD family antitoxin n=1 Tax=Devosia sp. TaxID=1871048 RepID=UPI001A48E7D0|nr:type II toxin-antitoxin system ParD family antitoxin [Devosia sp.]MBL8596692.1 type II toxin-antitoxin system ParD family antitoxin [Devosia sp.]
MPKVVKRTFSLTEEQAKFIDSMVESGGFATGSEVVRDGLRAMQEYEAAIERWLHEEVVPTLRELDADPSRARPVDEVFAELYAEIEEQQRLRERA